MRIATHNVKVTLNPDEAKAAVATALDYLPDVIGLQEWNRRRSRLLRELGGVVVLFPKLRGLFRDHPTTGYVWAYPIGGQPVGINAAVLELVAVRRIRLSRARRGVRPTYGTEAITRRRRDGETVPVLNVHPVAHRSRPLNALAGAEALEAMAEWADSWTGFDRYLLGDFNDGTVHIPGLTEAPNPGTLHGRPIDKILGRHPWADSLAFHTGSDHDGLVADEHKEIHHA